MPGIIWIAIEYDKSQFAPVDYQIRPVIMPPDSIAKYAAFFLFTKNEFRPPWGPDKFLAHRLEIYKKLPASQMVSDITEG
jgi:hypothetical protein